MQVKYVQNDEFLRRRSNKFCFSLTVNQYRYSIFQHSRFSSKYTSFTDAYIPLDSSDNEERLPWGMPKVQYPWRFLYPPIVSILVT